MTDKNDLFWLCYIKMNVIRLDSLLYINYYNAFFLF